MPMLGSFRRAKKEGETGQKGRRTGRSPRAAVPVEWEYGDEQLLHVAPSDPNALSAYGPNPFPPAVESAISPATAPLRDRGHHSFSANDNFTSQAQGLSQQTEDVDSTDLESRAYATENQLAGAFTGPQAKQRVEAVRAALEDALEQWWSQQGLISPALLRNSLLVLEAGYALDEAYLSLILRSALRLRRGMVTALRHQTDPDRAAYMLKEAILDEQSSLPPSTLWRFQQEDEQSEEWAELLAEDLRQEMPRLTGRQLRMAQAALNQLASPTLIETEQGRKGEKSKDQPRLMPGQPILIARPQSWPIGRSVLILVFLFVVATFYLWRQQRSVLAETAIIPAGQYTLGDVESSSLPRTVVVSEYAVDRTEVTNGAYRRCYEQGACPRPAATSSATHADYFDNPTFERFPVVNVDWRSATAYCAWAGKRLPNADEWEVAASVAPATGRRFRYPWGNLFDEQLANSAQSAVGDALQVGLRYPSDASPFGLADMAGNVAEWTATPASDAPVAGSVAYVVKGGSFFDAPNELAVNARKEVGIDSAEPWLGFRCIQVTN